MDAPISKTDSFLYACKWLDFLSLKPGNSQELEEYQNLVGIAKLYFAEGLYDQIAQYLQVSKYQVNYWAAYLILNYGQPDEQLRIECQFTLNAR